MKNHKIIAALALFCILLLHPGCEPQPGSKEKVVTNTQPERLEAPKTDAEKIEQKVEPVIPSEPPKIAFEKKLYDFGNVGPKTKNIGEFHFKNVGTGLLKITSVKKTCGCTPFTLAKKEYAPGEAGVLKFEYNASSSRGKSTKHIYVNSNDKKNPKVPLTIKANIILKVEVKPEKINLALRKENAGASEIVIKSSDGKPFAITEFKSTGNAITADFNPAEESTEFVLVPKVDMEKLKNNLSGKINVRLTHPECDNVSITYKTPAEFESVPKAIIVTNAEPLKPVQRELWIKNNYGDQFEVESAASKKGFIKLLSMEKIDNKIKLNLEVLPPEIQANVLFFSDTLSVNIKGADKVEINCRGFYSSKNRRN